MKFTKILTIQATFLLVIMTPLHSMRRESSSPTREHRITNASRKTATIRSGRSGVLPHRENLVFATYVMGGPYGNQARFFGIEVDPNGQIAHLDSSIQGYWNDFLKQTTAPLFSGTLPDGKKVYVTQGIHENRPYYFGITLSTDNRGIERPEPLAPAIAEQMYQQLLRQTAGQ